MLEHEALTVTAVSRPDVTTALTSVRPRRADAPGPETASSLSDNCIVPSPETESLIEPDQLPAGDITDDVVVGEVGVALPLQPAMPSTTAKTETNRRFIRGGS
jgi:hypothetical protein